MTVSLITGHVAISAATAATILMTTLRTTWFAYLRERYSFERSQSGINRKKHRCCIVERN